MRNISYIYCLIWLYIFVYTKTLPHAHANPPHESIITILPLFQTGYISDQVFSSIDRIPVAGGLILHYDYFFNGKIPQHHRFVIGTAAGDAYPDYHKNRDPNLYLNTNLHYSISLEVLKKKHYRLFVGTKANSEFSLIVPNFLGYSWAGDLAIHPQAELYIDFQKHRIHTSFDIALLGVMSRPYYHVYTYELGELHEKHGPLRSITSISHFVSLHNYIRLHIQTAHTYKWKKHVHIISVYAMQYSYISFPRIRHALIHNIQSGIQLIW